MFFLNDNVQLAISFCLEKHNGQKRKLINTPYAIHPISVSMLLFEIGEKDEIIISALLHDIIEDTNTTIDEIIAVFGTEVGNIVRDCTEPDKTLEWEERKKHTIDIIKNINHDSVMVILADKVHNLYSILQSIDKNGEKIWSVFKRGYEKQKWYYSNLQKSFLEKEYLETNELFFEFKRLYNIIFLE